MKKICFLILSLAITCRASAQTFISEDFSSGAMPPAGWAIDAHGANWSAEPSAKAGGTPSEAMLNWDPQFNGATRMISPYIDLTGYTSVKLMFKHFMDDYAGSGYSIGVATRTGTGTWNNVWSISPTGDVGPEEKILDISNGDVGSSQFQFCIFFNGNSYNIDYWYLDDIVLFIPFNLDGSMVKVTTPKYFNGKAPVNGVVRNMGQDDITELAITWTANGTEYFTTEFAGLSLAFSESFNFLCDDSVYYPIGAYDLQVFLTQVNQTGDDNPGNDTLNRLVSVVSNVVDRLPCFEEFTSSTCSPCASFNTSFNPWCASHADQITLVKYQMNWPGSGDPYYTAEGGVRRMYYGVSYVPWPQCNGAYVDYNIGAVQAAFDNAVQQPGLVRIAATHHLEGTVMTVTANILPFAAFNDFRAHIIVIENTTTGNASSNGETEFHHVMMKMMPDANGTALNVTDRNPVTITQSQDLSGTNIEEFDDLSVVVLFQDYGSAEIFQSVYSQEDATFDTEARCSDIAYDGIPIPGFSPDVYDYTIELPEGTIDIPAVTATAIGPYATVVVEPTWTLPGTTIVDCFGEDLMTHVRYTVHFDLAIGVSDPVKAAALVQVYPNPAKDRLFVKGAINSDIRIFSLTGQQVVSINNSNGTSIDISNLTNGIYTLQAVLEDQTIATRKFSIVR